MELDKDRIDVALLEKYSFHDYKHAIDILEGSYRDYWEEIQESLRKFEMSVDDMRILGGNKSPIPKKFDEELFPKDWEETRITGKLEVQMEARTKRKGRFRKQQPRLFENYIDGHNIDFVKGGVAFDIEWNSKDQTFDRDLLAMRTYYECDLIGVGVILTREEELDDIFNTLYYKNNKGQTVSLINKYGKSTTHMGKLIPRLAGRRNGGCPILAIGIKKKCVVDWDKDYIDPLKK